MIRVFDKTKSVRFLAAVNRQKSQFFVTAGGDAHIDPAVKITELTILPANSKPFRKGRCASIGPYDYLYRRADNGLWLLYQQFVLFTQDFPAKGEKDAD